MTLPAMMKSALVAIPLVAGLALTAAAQTVFHRGLGVTPQTLDLHKATNLAETAILRDLFEGLTTYDAGAAVRPGVAETWSISPDGLVWAFQLRKGAVWSNGDPVTGEDFVRAFRRLVDPATGSPHAWLLAAVENAAAIVAGKARPDSLGVYSPAPDKIRFSLTHPEPALPVLLAEPAAAPLHVTAVAADGKPAADPELVSNGAFRLAAWQKGETVELTRNAKYRDAGSVALDTVRYTSIADSGKALDRFRAGDLDAMDGVPVYRLADLRKELGDRLHETTYLGTYFLTLNLRDKALDSRLVRQALALTVDRDSLASGPWGGTMVPATALVPPGIAGHGEPATSSSLTVGLDIRQNMAQSLLEAAGYTAEKPLKISLRITPSDVQKATARAVAKAWATVGIQTEIVEETAADFQRNLARGRFGVAALGWIGDYGDPTAFLSMLSGDNEALNFSGYESADYDALLAESARTADPQARSDLLHRAEALLAKDMPVIPLLHYTSTNLVADAVAGWQDNVLNIHPSRWLSLPAAAVTATTEPAPTATAK